MQTEKIGIDSCNLHIHVKESCATVSRILILIFFNVVNEKNVCAHPHTEKIKINVTSVEK